ncbi:hypothetical protein [Hyphobacterium marinum]|uniref:Uncharacterized protein n=1 Tax=Hyphobacterium marinum TaxID=3116574 RepID=A0ABU7LVY0_9PROT|nr:hypothetical protein [Hyphobacterium sp. Y6023]MEE2565345.1 hypothetical protein [Hyphobacterium sp. Y6023]
MKNFNFHDTVGALRPMIERAGFVEAPRQTPGHKKRPVYNDHADATRFTLGDREIALASEKGDIRIILVEADEDPDRIDLDCPKRSAGKAPSPVYTASTLRCLKRKLNRWL